MIARLHRHQEESDKGFTLVELLVVIIIIGILSAVAVPMYLNQQKKAKDSATSSDVSTLGKELQTALVDTTAAGMYFTTKNNHYYIHTSATDTAGTDIGRVSSGVQLLSGATAVVTSTTATESDKAAVTALNGGSATSSDWCIGATNPDGKNMTYRYSATGGLESGKTCADA